MTTEDFSDYDVYLFDWDGLIVSTQELLYLSWKTAYQEETNDDETPLTFEEWSLFLHSSFSGCRDDLGRRLKPIIHKERMNKRGHELYDQMLRSSPYLRLLEGVEAFFSSLDPRRVFVVTSSSRAEVNLIRKRLQCPTLEAIPEQHWLTREIYIHRKPDPEGWNRAIQWAGWEQSKPAEQLKVVGFEDTPSGVHSLLASQPTCKKTCVLVSPFHYPDEWNNDPRVVRLSHF